MPSYPFEFSESLGDQVKRLSARLNALGVDPEILEALSLKVLAQIFEQRDDDLKKYLDGALIAAGYHVSAPTGTNCVTATPTALIWEAEDLATTSDAVWDPAVSTTKVTFSSEGLWLVHAGASWAATATGARSMEIKKNGVAVAPPVGATAPASANIAPRCSAGFGFASAAGDYLEVWATQDSGADKTAAGYLHAAFFGTTS